GLLRFDDGPARGYGTRSIPNRLMEMPSGIATVLLAGRWARKAVPLMFYRFGQFVVRTWPWWLSGWILAVGIAAAYAPDRDSVIKTGEFAFLPEDSPSRQ